MTYDEFSEEWHSDTDHIICHTSGSTGIPKEIALPKIQMKRSAIRTAEYFGLNKDSLLYSAISPDYIGGKMMFVRSAALGCGFGYEIPSNQPLRNYHGPRITMISVVPSQMLYILDNLHSLPPVDVFLVGGAPVNDTLRNRIIQSGLNVYESYGMTETSSHIAVRKIEQTPTPFHTLGDIRVALEQDVLRIDIPGWQSLVTNDVAEVLSPQTFRIVGRKDNVIISGGLKISPEEIENLLAPHIHIPFFISSYPDEYWGQAMILVAQLDKMMDTNLLTNSLQEICKKVLPSKKRPKRIILTDEIKFTPNGKIIRILNFQR